MSSVMDLSQRVAAGGDAAAGDAEAAAPPTKFGFEFHGSGAEYFRVWIVNILFSIVTLGIYSAWAKVRTRQYFYGNTTLDGSAFEYTANPVAILKGRLVIAGVFIVYSVVSNLYPAAQPLMMLILLPFIPWAIVRGLAFNARYSGYRNLRFHFDAGYWQAAGYFIGMPILVAFSLGLAFPWMQREQKRFVAEHHAYGRTPFRMTAKTGEFYLIYIQTVIIVVLLGLGGSAVGGLLSASYVGLAGVEGESAKATAGILGVLFTIVPLLGYLIAIVFIATRTANLVWSRLRIGAHEFQLAMRVRTMLKIQAVNLLMIVATLGLAIPFAQVRLHRYRLSRLTMTGPDNLDAFVAGERQRLGAMGEELGDALDLDLGL